MRRAIIGGGEVFRHVYWTLCRETGSVVGKGKGTGMVGYGGGREGGWNGWMEGGVWFGALVGGSAGLVD